MKLKNLTEILGDLIDRTLTGTTKINDFSFGSVIMSIYESISMELEQYYTVTRDNVIWGIENGVYEAYGFSRKEARRAYGDITIEFNTALVQDLYIPRGSIFLSTVTGFSQRFETLQDYYVVSGSSKATVRVYCTEVGTIGNIPSRTLNYMNNTITNIKSLYNEEAFLTGQEQEPLAQAKKRFQEYIETRARATSKAMKYAVSEVPDVSGVHLEDLTGYIKIYAHDMNGNLTETMKADIETKIEDYRPAGIPVGIFPVTKRRIDLELVVDVPLNMRIETLKLEIQQTIENYLNNFTASDDLILTDLTQKIMNIDDYNILDVTISGVSGNVTVKDSELIRAGIINVSFRGDV